MEEVGTPLPGCPVISLDEITSPRWGDQSTSEIRSPNNAHCLIAALRQCGFVSKPPDTRGRVSLHMLSDHFQFTGQFAQGDCFARQPLILC